MTYKYTTSKKGGCLFGCLWKLFVLAIIVLTVLGITLYFTFGYIGDYAIKTVTSGTEVTGGIGDVKINPSKESLEVKDFYITNPKRFKKEKAFAFKDAYIDLDITISDVLAKKLIVIDEITIEGLDTHIELVSTSKTNLHEIAEIIQKKYGINQNKQTAQQPQQVQATEESEPFKFIIKKLKFKNGQASSALLGNVFTTQLPDFEIENIGVENNGATINEIIMYVLPRIASQATQQISKKGWKASIDSSDSAIKSTKDSLKSATDGVKDGIKSLKSLF